MAKAKFTKAQREQILTQAIEFWDEATSKQSTFFDEVNDYNRLFHLKLPQQLEAEMANWPDRSNLMPPDIYNNVLAFEAAMTKLVFGKKPYGQISVNGNPRIRNEVTEKAEAKLTELIEIGNFKESNKKIIKQVAIAGRSCAFTEWHKVYRQVPTFNDGKVTGIERRLVAAYPRCRPLDIRRVRIDDKAENIEDIRVVGYHVKANLTDILTRVDDPDDPMELSPEERKDLEKSAFDQGRYYEHVYEEDTKYQHTDVANWGDKPIELMDIRGLFKIEGIKKPMDLIIKIGNRGTLLEARENELPIPGWELFVFPALDVEFNRKFPMGLVEPVLDLAVEQWLKRNQSIDKVNRDVYDMYIADMAAAADIPSRIPWYGGGVIKVHMGATGATSVLNVLAPLPKSGSSLDTFNHSAILGNEIQQTMRQSDFKQGTDPARKETATAVNELVAGGQRLDELAVDTLADTFYKPMWQNFLVLWNFFKGTQSDQVVIPTGEIVNIEPGELNHPFNITIDVSNSIERPLMIRRIIESYPFMKGDPSFDQYELNKMMVWALNLPNPDKLLPNPGWREAIIERENIAMLHGAVQPVHPLDNHQAHIEGHQKAMEQISQQQDISETDMGRIFTIFDKHLAQHGQFIEQIQTPGNQRDRQDSNQGNLNAVTPRIPNVNQAQPVSQPG